MAVTENHCTVKIIEVISATDTFLYGYRTTFIYVLYLSVSILKDNTNQYQLIMLFEYVLTRVQI